MTMPDERTRAVMQTRDFLRSLLDSEQCPGIPSDIRDLARQLLRHFPSSMEMRVAHRHCPDWFGEPRDVDEAAPAVRNA